MTTCQTKRPDAMRVLSRHGRSFRFAGRFLGRSLAQDCARLYAFCRHLDDLADEPVAGSDPLDALDSIERQLRSSKPATAAVGDFLELVSRHRIDLGAAFDLIATLRTDCGTVRIADDGALVRYAYGAAGTVGLMIAPILGARDRPALRHAIDLGIAMQMTNIARDVRDDAALGRRYLPGDWVAGLAPGDLLDPTPDSRIVVRTAIERLLVLADRYYASAEAGLGYLPPRSRLAIAVAARCYRAIGTRLLSGRPEWWEGRAVVGGAEKCRIALFEALPRTWTGTTGTPHDASLHHALAVRPHADG